MGGSNYTSHVYMYNFIKGVSKGGGVVDGIAAPIASIVKILFQKLGFRRARVDPRSIKVYPPTLPLFPSPSFRNLLMAWMY